jgi:hypothetical protein
MIDEEAGASEKPIDVVQACRQKYPGTPFEFCIYTFALILGAGK